MLSLQPNRSPYSTLKNEVYNKKNDLKVIHSVKDEVKKNTSSFAFMYASHRNRKIKNIINISQSINRTMYNDNDTPNSPINKLNSTIQTVQTAPSFQKRTSYSITRRQKSLGSPKQQEKQKQLIIKLQNLEFQTESKIKQQRKFQESILLEAYLKRKNYLNIFKDQKSQSKNNFVNQFISYELKNNFRNSPKTPFKNNILTQNLENPVKTRQLIKRIGPKHINYQLQSYEF